MGGAGGGMLGVGEAGRATGSESSLEMEDLLQEDILSSDFQFDSNSYLDLLFEEDRSTSLVLKLENSSNCCQMIKLDRQFLEGMGVLILTSL